LWPQSFPLRTPLQVSRHPTMPAQPSVPISRGALLNSTNRGFHVSLHSQSCEAKPAKRRRTESSHDLCLDDPEPKKKLRYTASEPVAATIVSEEEEDQDSDEGERIVRAPPSMSFARAMRANASARPRSFPRHLVRAWLSNYFLAFTNTIALEPLPSLRGALVSSSTTDAYTCQSATEDAFLTPPYAAAYSNGTHRYH
jgi:hypothetical protein